jgi:hypothetical protein
MDIAGAKALKERLGEKATAATPAAPADIPADAPPVYHYLGVSEAPTDTQSAAPVDEPPRRPRSLLRLLPWTSR